MPSFSLLGRPDMRIHLFEATRGLSTDKTEIKGLPMQALKLLSFGWSCDNTGNSHAVHLGTGGSVPVAEPKA